MAHRPGRRISCGRVCACANRDRDHRYPEYQVSIEAYVDIAKGDGLKMYKTRSGYAGAQYQGNRVIGKFVMTRFR